MEAQTTAFGGLRLSSRDPELPPTSQTNGWSALHAAAYPQYEVAQIAHFM